MLISVKDACVLQDNALDVRVSNQVEQLDELIRLEGNGAEFFARTHITQGMQVLLSEGLARLAGKSNQAVFHLKQAMGGGKTHLLIGFGLVAQNRMLRLSVCAGYSHIDSFESAKVAAFNGRNTPNEFFWGEIAQQLGKAEQFRAFWAGGPKAPDERDWIKLFEDGEPVLILLDEMPPYFQTLDTQPIGNGTVADIATRAFANLLTAASKKANVCVVISDLAAAYERGGRLILRALEDARGELGRQERTITPVDLAGNEAYDILRKRLFKSLPSQEVIDDIAALYGKALEEATKAKTASRGAEAIADEIAQTYPFHPRLKNLIALFKENEQYKQTRGLMELVSRLLKSVWQRPGNEVFLIGPQHFDLSIPDVREKLAEISGMSDVMAKDLWDSNHSAHTQMIDLRHSGDATAQVGALLLSASLSTAVNAVKGLTREEMVECLVTPLRSPSDFLAVFDELETAAWYLHHTGEGRYYFDRQENLTKLLQSLAHDAPDGQIEELIRTRLSGMFSPSRKSAYEAVLPLPKLGDTVDRVRKGRVLLIVDPDTHLPQEEVVRFFESLTQKNNFCILTGDKTQMASLDRAARQLFAGQKADKRIPPSHAQREELERKQQSYEQDFTATILNLFDKVFFPIQRPGQKAQLVSKPLEMTRDATKAFDGELQIEKTLTNTPRKLHLDVDADFDILRDKAQDLLWPENQDEARWSDVLDRMAEEAAMPWLPPKGIELVKAAACNQGLWEDLGNGYITKKPTKKKTAAQIVVDSEPDDQGRVRLRVNAQNAGPAPVIYYAEDGEVTRQSQVLTDQTIFTHALRVRFLIHDPSGQYETGEAALWTNRLVIRNRLFEEGGQRKVELLVAPTGELRFTLDGSEPRQGTQYSGPFGIGDGDALVRVLAETDGLESKADFSFPARHKKGVQIDPVKAAAIHNKAGGKRLDSRAKTYSALSAAKEKGVEFENVTIAIGQGSKVAQVVVGEIRVDADYIERVLGALLQKFDPSTPVTMSFRKAHFHSGHDMQEFSEQLGLPLQQSEIEQ